jgi:FkbM family methyltransferase
LKKLIKDVLLHLSLYYKVNAWRFRHDTRNRSQKAFYSTVIQKSDLVFDVGANVGQRTAIFSDLARLVVAFEPQAECLRHLKSRFRFKRNVQLQPVALSDSEGEAVIFQSSSHTISSMSEEFVNTVAKTVFADDTWDQRATINTRTLDQMIALYGMPGFIKIDVEGFEINVLRGLSHPAPFLSFEFIPVAMNEVKKCLARLHEISEDYLYDYCLGEDLEFVLPAHVNYETFVNEIIPRLETAATFGDIYAILK